jgi:hypothetical protein
VLSVEKGSSLATTQSFVRELESLAKSVPRVDVSPGIGEQISMTQL